MTYRCLDSIIPGNLPAGADAYLGYIGGRWPTWAAVRRMFPKAHVISLAIAASLDAEGLDIERGDAEPAEAPAWVRRQQARGVDRPVLYAGAAAMQDVLAALTGAGIGRGAVRLISAHYGQGKHICGPHVPRCGYPSVDGTQWRDNAPGVAGSLIDESVLEDGFFGAAAAAGKDDDMGQPFLLNRGEGAVTPIALPNGASALRFFASQKAQVRVDLRKGGATEVLDLGYDSAHAVQIPRGIHAVVAHRVDGGENDVSCAVT